MIIITEIQKETIQLSEKRISIIEKNSGKSLYENMIDNTEEIDKLKSENIILKERLTKIEKVLEL